MKRTTICFFAVFLMLSCSDGVVQTNETAEPSEKVEGVVCQLPDLVDDSDEPNSRSVVTLGTSGMEFAWEKGDIITVYGDDNNKGDFTLQSMDDNMKTGFFDGGGFALSAGKPYHTLSKSKTNFVHEGETEARPNIPLINGNYNAFNADSRTNIQMSYDGQRQVINEADQTTGGAKATDHLGQYDYMTALANATENNSAHFYYKRLGCVLRIVIKGLPADVKYTKLTMYDASENLFREMARTTNIDKTSSTSEYTPYLNEPVLNESSERFSIMLGKQDDNGIEQGLCVAQGKSLVVYMMIPPIDLTNRTIAFRLTPKTVFNASNEDVTPKPYFCLYKRSKPFSSGTAVQMTMTAEECTQYKINIQVVLDWIRGNSTTQSRATGDPGTTETEDIPTHLYAFFVNDGKLVQSASATPVYTEAKKDWTLSNGILTLNSNIEWSITGEKGTSTAVLTLDNTYKNEPKVYVIASNNELSGWKDGSGNNVTLNYSSENGTSEEIIRALTFNYPSSDATSFIRGLYSTPYNSTYNEFAGALTDDVKDVRLYHVASKVDVNWENTTSTALSGNVSVNNFPTTNLSFFKPTTANTISGSTTVSTPITTGTAYNGRAVFYLPQPSSATYNVTIGNGAAQEITFTPDPVFTSWFRGLITIKD